MKLATASIVLGILLIIGSVIAEPYACREGWQGTGYKAKYNYLVGCMVTKDGITWVPAQNVRVVN